MIKIESVETFGWEAAIRGMRNPLNSWEKSDSRFLDEVTWAKEDTARTAAAYAAHTHDINDQDYVEAGDVFDPLVVTGFSIGPNDEKLMKTLIRGGPVECKFRRMIHVQMDITAPLYWWKEFDTYKVGTVANSCSTMHKIHAKEFELNDFSWEQLLNNGLDLFDYVPAYDRMLTTTVQPISFLEDYIIPALNDAREKFLETKDKKYWWQMIQLLPSSYNQRRTVDISYEVLANIYRHRKGHKLDEWRKLCFDLSQTLPYSWIFTENFEGGAGWKEKEPDYKDILLRIAALVKEGKIKQEDILEAVGFSFEVDLSQHGDSQTVMNLKSQEVEANAQRATNLKEEKKRLDPFTREGEQQMLEEIRNEVMAGLLQVEEK